MGNEKKPYLVAYLDGVIVNYRCLDEMLDDAVKEVVTEFADDPRCDSIKAEILTPEQIRNHYNAIMVRKATAMLLDLK